MPTVDLDGSGDWSGSNSPFDSAWRSRIPPGWIQFADGTFGPPNPPSPYDQGWPSRVPRPGGIPVTNQAGQPLPMPGAPGPAPGAPMQLPGATPPTQAGGAYGPPDNPPGPPGGANPFTNGPRIDPAQLAGAGGGSWLTSLLGNMNPYFKAAIAGAGAIAPTKAETGELPPQFWHGVPSGPVGPGGIGSDARFPLSMARGPSSTSSQGGGFSPAASSGGIGSDARFPLAGPSGRNAQPMHPSSLGRMPSPAAAATAPPAPTLGYYQAAGGNARGAQPMQYTDPNDPRIYRGPLTMSGADLGQLLKRARG